MYIALELSTSERGDRDHRVVKKFDDLQGLEQYILTTCNDLARIEFYEARPIKLQIGLDS